MHKLAIATGNNADVLCCSGFSGNTGPQVSSTLAAKGEAVTEGLYGISLEVPAASRKVLTASCAFCIVHTASGSKKTTK
jgi:hypothetical protein